MFKDFDLYSLRITPIIHINRWCISYLIFYEHLWFRYNYFGNYCVKFSLISVWHYYSCTLLSKLYQIYQSMRYNRIIEFQYEYSHYIVSLHSMHHVIQPFSTLVEIIAASELIYVLITNISFDTVLNINIIYSYNFYIE